MGVGVGGMLGNEVKVKRTEHGVGAGANIGEMDCIEKKTWNWKVWYYLYFSFKSGWWGEIIFYSSFS